MAGERQAPGLGLYTGWTEGSNGWGEQHDDGIVAVSVLLQGRAISRTTSLPGSPSQGDIYVIPSGDTDGNDIAAYDDSAWVRFTPAAGYAIWITDEAMYYHFDGTNWVEGLPTPALTVREETSAYSTVAGDFNGRTIIEVNNASAIGLTVAPSMAAKQPLIVRQTGAGQVSIVAGSGVTLRSQDSALDLTGQYASCVITPTGTADTYHVDGSLE